MKQSTPKMVPWFGQQPRVESRRFWAPGEAKVAVGMESKGSSELESPFLRRLVLNGEYNV